MNNSSNSTVHDSLESVAIIGMSGRFPGATNIEDFWGNIRDGVESISFFSDQDLLSSGVDPAMVHNPHYVKARGVLGEADRFDASFFGLTPREAEIMDPQHRVFLEGSWTALEDAGYDPGAYRGRVAVYAGAGMNTYLLNLYAHPDLIDAVGEYQVAFGNDKDYLATRVSYKLNLTGPSITVQSACSSSLVAVDLACQSLANYQCDMALAGGVSISLPQTAGYIYQEGGILSPDGHCRTFDAHAQGTVSGNGMAVIVLKRLEDAIADDDHIYAIIKGSATNNDGASKVGYTAPSVTGQALVVMQALALACVEPETISYVEAHGTGTQLGDPIEIAALTQAFRASTQRTGFCAIGSVKTNVGHLDAAAGVTGVIKATLALTHKVIPPSLHFDQPNPAIDFANSPFYVNTTLSKWASGPVPRRAAVSAFGVGGTNTHLILEEAPPPSPSEPHRHLQLLTLSARTSAALDAATAQLAGHMRRHRLLDLADVAYTLQTGRRAFAHRRVLVCSDVDDALNALETPARQRMLTGYAEPRAHAVAFMFPGQGAQYVDMGSDLYRSEPTFRDQVDQCAKLLEPHLGLDLRRVLYPDRDHVEEMTQVLQQTWITQPALFVIEYSLARLWMEWGVRPAALIGHSIGEYVAACLAGVFTLADALAVVAARGRLMQGLPKGAMLAVPLSAEEIQPMLGPDLSVAAINGPSLCVVSGTSDAVDSLDHRLADGGVQCRRLRTSHAFHSPMMAPVMDDFADLVRQVPLAFPQMPFVSNVSGDWITAKEATSPDYWARHLRQTVRFADGLHALLAEPGQALLEVGPGQTLSALAKSQVDGGEPAAILSSLRHPQIRQSDEEFALKTYLIKNLGAGYTEATE